MEQLFAFVSVYMQRQVVVGLLVHSSQLTLVVGSRDAALGVAADAPLNKTKKETQVGKNFNYISEVCKPGFGPSLLQTVRSVDVRVHVSGALLLQFNGLNKQIHG